MNLVIACILAIGMALSIYMLIRFFRGRKNGSDYVVFSSFPIENINYFIDYGEDFKRSKSKPFGTVDRSPVHKGNTQILFKTNASPDAIFSTEYRESTVEQVTQLKCGEVIDLKFPTLCVGLIYLNYN